MDMFFNFSKKSVLIGLIVFSVVILLISLAAGCSKKAEQERAAVSKSETEGRQIPKATEQVIKYSNETGVINTLADKLNASRTPETAKDVEEKIKKPASFIEEYLRSNPDTPEGTTALKLIATTYQTVDGIIGGQTDQITKAYKLLLDLYPKSQDAAEAKAWVDSHK